jgi:hypothetical protein
MTAVFPGGGPNTYVPSAEATKGLVVDFSRNVESFALNKWIQIIPVTKSVGYYLKMTVEQAGRLLSSTLTDMIWPDGNDAPSGRGNTEKFEFLAYGTTRYTDVVRLGQKMVDEASWDILAQYGRIQLQKLMTARTQKAVTLAQTTGTYDSSHTSAVSSISGVTGKWDASTTARQDIKRSLDYAKELMFKDTLGGINVNDIKLVMSPGCARKMSVSQEIVDLIKGAPDAKAWITGEFGSNAKKNMSFGLPPSIYGTEIIIEDAVKVTSKKGATLANSYVCSDTSPFLCSRPGSLVAPTDSNSAPNFSTFAGFFKEELSVETKHDVDNRVHLARVTDDYHMVAIAPVSGFLFTAAVAS